MTEENKQIECVISRSKKKMSTTQHVLEEETLTVQGKDLKEVEKRFKRYWGK